MEQEMQEEKSKLKQVILLAEKSLEEAETAYEKLEENTTDEYSIVTMRKNVWNENKKLKASNRSSILCKSGPRNKQKQRKNLHRKNKYI